MPELEPRQFSFNSPYGACDACGGLGTRKELNPELLIGDPSHLHPGGRGAALGRAARAPPRTILAGLAAASTSTSTRPGVSSRRTCATSSSTATRARPTGGARAEGG